MDTVIILSYTYIQVTDLIKNRLQISPSNIARNEINVNLSSSDDIRLYIFFKSGPHHSFWLRLYKINETRAFCNEISWKNTRQMLNKTYGSSVIVLHPCGDSVCGGADPAEQRIGWHRHVQWWWRCVGLDRPLASPLRSVDRWDTITAAVALRLNVALDWEQNLLPAGCCCCWWRHYFPMGHHSQVIPNTPIQPESYSSLMPP